MTGNAARQLELTCLECGRVLKQAEDVVVRRVKEGKPLRCLFCAKDLPLPDELVTRLVPRRRRGSPRGGWESAPPACDRPRRRARRTS